MKKILLLLLVAEILISCKKSPVTTKSVIPQDTSKHDTVPSKPPVVPPVTPPTDSTFTIINPTTCSGTTITSILWGVYIKGGGNYFINTSATITDASGNFYVAGKYNGAFYFNATSYLTGQGIFLEKLDATGNLLWVKKVTDILQQGPSVHLCFDHSGNIFVSSNIMANPGAFHWVQIFINLTLMAIIYSCYHFLAKVSYP